MSYASQFTVWDNRTGAVIRTGSCPTEHVWRQVSSGWEEVVAEYQDGDTEYHDGTGWSQRSTMLLAVNGATVGGLPIPCRATVEGVNYEITDGVAEFSFAFPGAYKIVFTASGYLDASVTIQWPLSLIPV